MKHEFEQIFQKPFIAFVSGIRLLSERLKMRQIIDGAISRFVHLINRPQLSNEEDLPVTEKNGLPDSKERDFITSFSENVNNYEMFSGESSLTESAKSETLNEDLSGKNALQMINEKKLNFEEKEEMDRDLRDDMLKLVRYKVLFVKREDERVIDQGDELVYDNMDNAAFTAWKIAQMNDNNLLQGISDDDKKYLRVFYEVLDRYPREKFKYEEQQIDVLREIRDKIDCKDSQGNQNP